MLISAYAFGGTPEKAVKKVFSEADLYLTPDLLKEYRDVPLALEAEGKKWEYPFHLGYFNIREWKQLNWHIRGRQNNVS